jgi:outer membrane protein assembly factor BamA
VLAVIAACHHAPVHKPGDDWVQSVRFEGNHELSSKSLLSGLALHRSEERGYGADPYQLQLDAQRIRGQYLREGFFDADVQARVERHGDAETVVFSIREGKRATTRVEIRGLPPGVRADDVRAALPIADGAPFSYEAYDDAKPQILAVVQNAGYARAHLDAAVNAEIATRTAVIELSFTPGVKCRFGKVDVTGVSGDLEQAIRERVHFETGDVYSPRALVRTQRDIYRFGRFATVEVLPEQTDGDSPVVDVRITVSESARHELAYGGGFGIDPISYEARLRGGYSILGWPAPLYNLTLDLRPAYAYLRDGSGFEPRIRAIAKLDRLDLFLTHAIGSVEVDFNYLAYEAFTEYGPELKLNYQVELGTRRVVLGGGWLIQRYDFRDISPLVVGPIAESIGLDQPELAAAYTESLQVDLRDHPIEPRYGAYAAFTAYQGGPFAGGSYTYEEIIPELRLYAPLGPVVLAARARYGAIYGDIPPTERFYAGGASSNRGFSERDLSPSVTGTVMGSTLTVPYGGGGMIDSSFEARLKAGAIHKMPLEEVVFLDGGDVTETPQQLDIRNLCWAVGAGLRLLTIVGAARVDVGYRLNRTGVDDPEPGSTWAFHIGLGEAF